ncbi:MAG: adenylate/guanylate cyclase domain-containing protein [Chthoniobacterales bacterium]
MKRPLLGTLIIGFVVAASIGVLHGMGMLLGIERPIADLVSRQTTITRVAIVFWQYLLVTVFSFGVAAFTLTSVGRARSAWLALALLIELVVLTWVCSLYGVLLQPLPSILAVALALIAAESTITLSTRTRAGLAKSFFAGRLSKEQIQRAIAGEIPVETEPRSCEATVVVCDIANKYDLLEDSAPGAFAESAQKFLRQTTELFLKAGGYIASADGEGVVALFGFPDGDAEHANKAVRVGLELVQMFRQSRQQNDGDRFGNCDAHLGVSSGTMIVAPLKDGQRPSLFTTGEPVELARRFCVANRFYGSRILVGPQTFDLIGRTIVARPIDFLSGVNSQERHEIYEPLWMAAEAKPEHIARRDYFWNGVVLYREKRWAEAYTEFQKARGPDTEEDAPLELYLRRLEPLALHLVETQ